MSVNASDNGNVRSFCAFCGKPILPNAKFCSYCGQSQVPDTLEQVTQPVAPNDVTEVKVKVSKSVRRESVFLVLEVIFAVITMTILLLTVFSEFKGSSAEVIAFSGAKKSIVTSDLKTYHLLIVGMIVATVFSIATIVCFILRCKTNKDLNSLEIVLLVIFVFLTISAFILTSIKMRDNSDYYEMLQVMDEKKPKKGFVSYDIHTDE